MTPAVAATAGVIQGESIDLGHNPNRSVGATSGVTMKPASKTRSPNLGTPSQDAD